MADPLHDFDDIMLQNKENEKNEALQSQSQPQPQPYETSQPQLYQAPQFQPYQSSQPQPYQASQPQPYQTSQPQIYQPPLPQASLNINPPVPNYAYQSGSNQSPNYVINPNSNLDNHELFHDDLKAANSGRLKCQLILAILLFIIF